MFIELDENTGGECDSPDTKGKEIRISTDLQREEELEVVIGGYSSSGKKIYAINADGSDVSGFPVDVDEKMIKGVALYDFNNNGKDDIVFGSDSDNISLLLDDGTLSWSYSTGDKIQSAPSIINTGSEILVCAGSKDGGPVAQWEIPDRFRWLTAQRSSSIQTSRPHNGFSDNLDKTLERLFVELVL